MHPLAAQPDQSKGSLRGLALWLLVLCFLRLLFLVAALDPEEERIMNVLDSGGITWSHGPERPLYDREELYTATAGEALRHHLPVPLARYRYMPYASGSLLLSIIAAGVYALFTPSYLAFKLIPLVITLLAGSFWFLFVRSWLGRGAGWVFGLLYLLAPSILLRTALIAKGDHPEAMMLIGGVLCLGTAAARQQSNRGKPLLVAATGALAGFSIFVTYATVPILAAAALAALMATRGRPRWLIPAALAGLLFGLLPWFGNLLATGDQALRVYSRPLGAMVPAREVFGRLALLVNRGFLAEYDLPGGRAVQTVTSLLFVAGALAGWVVLLRRRGTFATIVLWGTLAHLGAFCLLAPDASSRYLIPGYPLLLIAVLSPLAGSFRGNVTSIFSPLRPGPRSLIVLLLLACGLLAQAWVLARSDYVALRRPLKGTDWPLLGEVMGQKMSPADIRRLPAQAQPYLWVGLGKRIFLTADPSQWQAEADQAGDQAAKVWEGIGMSWAEQGGWEKAGPFLHSLPAGERTAFLHGFTVYSEVLFAPLLREGGEGAAAAILNTFDPSDQVALRLGLARTLGILTLHASEASPDGWRAAAQLLRPQEAWLGAGWALFREKGAGVGFRKWRPPPGTWVFDLIEQTPDPSEAGYWSGVAEAYAARVETRSDGWILGGQDGPAALARDLDQLTRGWTEARAGLFYWTTGQAVARCVREPYAAEGLSTSSWPWRLAIPAPYHSAFQAGLTQGGLTR